MENSLKRTWPNSQLNIAISCLTYGLACLYFDRNTNGLTHCLLSLHEEYINIVHVIIEGRASLLFQLQNVKNISDKDLYIRQALKQLRYEYFLVVYTSTLESFVLVMPTENELNVLWEGLQYFIYEANAFYSRISMIDPFKAESAMLFMNADADGSKLLDIDEVMYIFKKLKIKKDRLQVEESIKEVNYDLYEKENLRRPKDFTLDKLTPLGFEYILQYYSLKVSLAPLFTEFCPIFKFKHKKFKKSIIDLLKGQTKPLMSGIQFQQFLQKCLKVKKTEQQCVELIKTFPVYDGQGKQIPEQVQFLSFQNFCNYVFSSLNCICEPTHLTIHQDMTLPLTEYFIYSSSNTYLSSMSIQAESQLQMYEFSLKKGCRCLELDINVEKDEVVVKHVMSKNYLMLADVLSTIKNICFSFNPFPLILSLECNFATQHTEKVANVFKKQLSDYLYYPKRKDAREVQLLPSPQELKNKILLQLVGNSKKPKDEDNPLYKLVTLMPTKIDFERKGQTCWDTCQLLVKQINRYEEIEDKNLTDYCRKIIVRTSPSEINGQMENFDPMPMFRNGVQLAGINMQKEDENHYLVHSLFLRNGGRSCGYLLKPYWMRSNCLESLYASSFKHQTHTIKIKVYAGQKFVLTDTSCVSFYLRVELKGNKAQQQANKKHKSQPKTQGFYSDFELQLQFKIFCPELAVITFSIVDENQKVLSYRAVPFLSIREGLRTLELLGPGMEICSNSSLLVYSTITEQKRKRKISSVLT